MPTNIQEEQLREEFNRWAEAGRGEDMEQEHLPITLRTLALMNVKPDDRVLDVGCGAGWLPRLIARRVPQGRVAGMDVSDEMIRRAQEASAGLQNLEFRVGGADHIPWDSGSFAKVISVESAYYWPRPARGIGECLRVLAPGGSVWILIEYYRDNPYCRQWSELFKIPAHWLWAEEWAGLMRAAGFRDVVHQRIPDEAPVPDPYTGRWFRDADEFRKFRAEGALLVYGTKPNRAAQ